MIPHTIRGHAILSTLALVRRHPAGDELIASLDGEDQAFFRDEVFLAGTRYPIEPFFRLTERLARASKQTMRAYMNKQSMRMAAADAEGIYRASLNASDAPAMAARLPRAFNRYFEPPKAELESIGEGCARFVLHHLRRDLEDFYLGANDGFVLGAMERVSTRPKIEYVASKKSPDDNFSVRFKVTWS